MVHDSMRNLRLDKRLLRRRGWVAPEELGKELEGLPDVSAKADRIAILESSESEEASQGQEG
jgi:hypothetical protein